NNIEPPSHNFENKYLPLPLRSNPALLNIPQHVLQATILQPPSGRLGTPVLDTTGTPVLDATGPPPRESSPRVQRSAVATSSNAGLFANLTSMKRNPEDEAGAARRKSIEDMNKPVGMLGNLWNNAFKNPSQNK
ncbi:hypothetical protein LTR28_003946, partial [Elasticomyces elasticus]